jgi:hypothetical protein
MGATCSTETLIVHENGQPIHFTFADLMKYHGFGYPGGVAHAFKVMQRAFPLLDGGAPPERQELHLETSFGGPGGRDAFEMVTRMATSGRYIVNKPEIDTEKPLYWEAYYRFSWRYRERRVTLAIRSGHVREEFIRLGSKPDRDAAEEARLIFLKSEMADRLMKLPAEELYDISPLNPV